MDALTQDGGWLGGVSTKVKNGEEVLTFGYGVGKVDPRFGKLELSGLRYCFVLRGVDAVLGFCSIVYRLNCRSFCFVVNAILLVYYIARFLLMLASVVSSCFLALQLSFRSLT